MQLCVVMRFIQWVQEVWVRHQVGKFLLRTRMENHLFPVVENFVCWCAQHLFVMSSYFIWSSYIVSFCHGMTLHSSDADLAVIFFCGCWTRTNHMRWMTNVTGSEYAAVTVSAPQKFDYIFNIGTTISCVCTTQGSWKVSNTAAVYMHVIHWRFKVRCFVHTLSTLASHNLYISWLNLSLWRNQ